MNLGELLSKLYRPPAVPDLNLGWGANALGVMDKIKAVVELAYYQGFKDGMLTGALAVLALMVLMMLSRYFKAVTNGVI